MKPDQAEGVCAGLVAGIDEGDVGKRESEKDHRTAEQQIRRAQPRRHHARLRPVRALA